MALLGEVDAFANDVVAAVIDGGDERCWGLGVWCWVFGVGCWMLGGNRNAVTHGHGVGAPNALQPEITLYLTIKQLAIVRADGVPTACILHY
jgi:hypothetical protein